MGAFAIAIWRLLLWMLGFLALISLIAWLSPDQSGSPTVPGWAKFLVWALFFVPIVPAVSAGVARLHGNRKSHPIAFGAVFGLMAPIFGLASLVAIFVLAGFNLDLGLPDARVPDFVVLVALLLVAVALGVATGFWRDNANREH